MYTGAAQVNVTTAAANLITMSHTTPYSHPDVHIHL